MSNNIKIRWNKVYEENEDKELGWYQNRAKPSLELLAKTNIRKEDIILDVGSGTSVFISNLLALGYRNIIATDISEIALRKSKDKLGEKSKLVTFIEDDVTQPSKINKLKNIAVWHDRAVFHFLTKDKERRAYLETLNNVLRTGGYIIIGTFSLESPKKCSGLDVVNYNAEMLEKFFDSNYTLQASFDYMHYTPLGNKRPFVYALFKRVE